jgi:hypothetical protein
MKRLTTFATDQRKEDKKRTCPTKDMIKAKLSHGLKVGESFLKV